MNFLGLELLVNGIVIGFSASVPLGPIGVVCVQRTINKGRTSGFVSGLGAAISDTFYAVIAGLGLTFIINFLREQQTILQFIGGAFLLFIGFRIFYSNPVHEIRKLKRKKSNLFEDFMSVFFLTFSNPMAGLLFIAIFAGLGVLNKAEDLKLTMIMVSGVFLGASFWWFILSSLVNRFRHKVRLKQLWWINKIAGLAIIVFAVAALGGLLLIWLGTI